MIHELQLGTAKSMYYLLITFSIISTKTLKGGPLKNPLYKVP